MRELTLEEIKQIELDILDYIDEVCHKYGLRYYLHAGTLLGAVRHKGFIPWDDDIDVSMPRKDFEKLKELMGESIHEERFKLLTYEHEDIKYSFIKIVDFRTVLYEKYMNDAMGIWVDIFPIDGMPDSYRKAKFLCYKLELYRRLLNVSMAKDGMGTTKGRLIIKTVIKPIVSKIPYQYMCKKVNSIFKKYDFDKTDMVGAVSGGCSYKGIVSRDMYDVEQAEFEQKKYNIPKGWERVLSQMYGNYMELPPEDKRIRHEFRAYLKEMY